jgi:hypothetical protein
LYHEGVLKPMKDIDILRLAIAMARGGKKKPRGLKLWAYVVKCYFKIKKCYANLRKKC